MQPLTNISTVLFVTAMYQWHIAFDVVSKKKRKKSNVHARATIILGTADTKKYSYSWLTINYIFPYCFIRFQFCSHAQYLKEVM